MCNRMKRNIVIVGWMSITIIICIILTVLLSGCITRGHPNVILVENSLSATQTGDQMTISGQVKNIGNATAHNTRIRIYRVYECKWGGTGWSASINYEASQNLGDIASNETVDFEVSDRKRSYSPSRGQVCTAKYKVAIYSEEDNWVYHSSKSFTRGLERVE